MFERLMSRIKNLVDVSDVTGVKTAVIQIRTATGRMNDRIKRLHNYGFMSRPLEGAKSYTLFVGGTMSRGLSVCVEDERFQMELKPGEVAVLDYRGNLVHFTEEGIRVKSIAKIVVEAKQDITVNTGGDIIANAANIKMNGGAGVCTGDSICPFTGHPHVDVSTTVFAGK